ncbi:unnamed protein product [Sphagnum troendelagicum]
MMMMMMSCGSRKLVIQTLDKIREGRMQEQLGIDLSSDKWILQQQQLPRNYYGLQLSILVSRCDENDDDDDRFLRPTRILGQSMIARRRFASALQEILNATRTVGPQ